jgi:hypothetical protein
MTSTCPIGFQSTVLFIAPPNSFPGVNQTTAAYIGVTGVDDLYGHCQRRGAAVVTPLTDHPRGLRGFVIEIPGGHPPCPRRAYQRFLAPPCCPEIGRGQSGQAGDGGSCPGAILTRSQ